MTTTAGSLALEGSIPPRDALRGRAAARGRRGAAGQGEHERVGEHPLGQVVRAAGARAAASAATRTSLDRNPCGSSSGSGAAVAANLCAVAVGTETDGSIVCPSNANGHRRHQAHARPRQPRRASSRSPTARTRPGPWRARSATPRSLLGALAGVDPRDAATADSRGARRGRLHALPRRGRAARARASASPARSSASTATVDRLFEAALAAMKAAGRRARRPGGHPARERVRRQRARGAALRAEGGPERLPGDARTAARA